MEPIKQLKAIRDAARARIEASADYRLVTSLGALIGELEEAISTGAPAAAEGTDEDQPEDEPDGAAAHLTRAEIYPDAEVATDMPADGLDVEVESLAQPDNDDEQSAALANGNASPQSGESAGESAETGEDAAIEQAFAELEADLESATSFESEPRKRRGY